MTPESILEFEAACQKTLAEMKESRSTFPDNSWTDGFFQGANSYHSHLLGVLATLRDSKEVKVCPTKDIDDENIEDEFQRHIAKYGGKACYDEGFHCYRHNPCCHCGTSLSPDDTKETK
jgi:hypothetical protein